MATTGRHHHRVSKTRRWTRRALIAALAAAVAITVTITALGPTAPVVPMNAATIPADQAETIFVAELAAAGVPLSLREAQKAIEIARVHVAHDHLIGMREPIRSDLRAAFPDLTEEQIEIAKTAVEHHFLAVTGRRQ